MPCLNDVITTKAEERKKLIADARKLLVDDNGNAREMSSEDKERWDKMQGDVDSMREQIDRLCKQRDDEKDETGPEEEEEEDKRDDDKEDEDERDEDEKDDDEDEDKRNLFRLADGRLVRVVKPGKNPQRTNGRAGGLEKRQLHENEYEYRARMRRNSPEYRKAFWNYFLHGDKGLHIREARAIQADSDIIGGYLVAPQEFVAKLIKFVDNLLFIRQKATKFTVASAQSLGAPSLDTDVADSDWTSELATGNEDTALAFGKRELYPHPLAKRLKVSNRLLRMAQSVTIASAYDATGAGGGGVEGLVRGRLGYKFAVTEEKAFQTGNGSQQPLGMFTASARGISTARDVLTGSSTGFVADQLIAAKYSLKVQYQQRAEWLFSRLAVQNIRQLKDNYGQYLWQPGLAGGDPDTILDRPVNISEYCPNTFTTGQYVGLLGDFSFYWIADSEQMSIQRLVELYAEANQIGFIARMELDGMPVLEEAFTRLITN